jgi:hypothetical protein
MIGAFGAEISSTNRLGIGPPGYYWQDADLVKREPEPNGYEKMLKKEPPEELHL